MRCEITVEIGDRLFRAEVECSDELGFEVLMNMARNNIQELHEWAEPRKESPRKGVNMEDDYKGRPIRDMPQA